MRTFRLPPHHLLSAGLLFGAVLLAPAQPEPTTPPAEAEAQDEAAAETRHAAALKLISTAKMDTAFPRMLEELISAYRTELKRVPEEFWTDFTEKVDYTPLREALAKQYAAEFTTDELEQLTTFYASPVGKKLVARNLEIQRVFAIDSRNWAKKTKNELVRQLKRKSYMY